MKKIIFLISGCIILSLVKPQAQTVDEIFSNYFENTGGLDKWKELKGIKMTAKANQFGMEFPIVIVQMTDGRQYLNVEFQGMTIRQGVFDGNEVWNTNFQSMQAEKADDETSANVKLDSNDFPESFYNYKEKGYTAELLGTETTEGTETFKVKLVREPKTYNGEKVEDILYIYFDTESFVPILEEQEIKSGPLAGSIQQTKRSDYQEVGGLYFPYSFSQGIKGGEVQVSFIAQSIELNPAVSDADFAFPEK